MGIAFAAGFFWRPFGSARNVNKALTHLNRLDTVGTLEELSDGVGGTGAVDAADAIGVFGVDLVQEFWLVDTASNLVEGFALTVARAWAQ